MSLPLDLRDERPPTWKARMSSPCCTGAAIRCIGAVASPANESLHPADERLKHRKYAGIKHTPEGCYTTKWL
ncbi:MAG TPA: hypothetical protein VGE52_07200 [Pirellulales bacterium]